MKQKKNTVIVTEKERQSLEKLSQLQVEERNGTRTESQQSSMKEELSLSLFQENIDSSGTRKIEIAQNHFEPPSIIYNDGIHLTGTILWFDAIRKHDLCFISNSVIEKIGKSDKVFSSSLTLDLLSAKGQKLHGLPVPFHKPFSLGSLEIELFPAGLIPGGAQIAVQYNGQKIVYVRNMLLKKTLISESAPILPSEILILDCHYGHPRYRFPPRSEAFERLEQLVRDSFENKKIPIIFAEPIGITQELIVFFDSLGYRCRLHQSTYKITRTVFQHLGLKYNNFRLLQKRIPEDEVVIFPPILRGSSLIQSIKNRVNIVISGEVLTSQFHVLFPDSEGIALASSADFAELVQYVHISKPKQVFVIGRNADTFSHFLRKDGYHVWTLTKPEQLSLL